MTERPLTETLYCTLIRCDSSHCVRETGFEEALATENEGKMLMRENKRAGKLGISRVGPVRLQVCRRTEVPGL